jgi:DNA-binding FadR family transcriptional regulator
VTGKDGAASHPVRVERIRKASEQVAAQLRALILKGELPSGAKLPTEQGLAQEFGVSRATIREALMALGAEGLIRTTKGVQGGSFVTTPSPDRAADALNLAVTLLSQANRVTLDQLLEVREYLEIPAARAAAARGSEVAMKEMDKAIPSASEEISATTQFDNNRDFHRAILHATGNTLLAIAAEPIFKVLQTRMTRANVGPSYYEEIRDQHERIAGAVQAGDPDLAEQEMRDHLAWLRPHYESIWEEARPEGGLPIQPDSGQASKG